MTLYLVVSHVHMLIFSVALSILVIEAGELYVSLAGITVQTNKTRQ